MFHMLAGRPPFEATSASMMLIAQLQEVPQRLYAIDPALRFAVADLVGRALAKDAAARPADMATFRHELLAAGGLPDVAAEELAASASSSHQAAVAGRDPDPVAAAPAPSASADAAGAVAPPSDAAVTHEIAAACVTLTPRAIDAGVPASVAATDKTAPKPSNAYHMHMQRVAELYRQGARRDVLLPVYRDALQANPAGLEALVAAGRCLADSRHYTDARDLFRRALGLAPRDERALSGLAEMSNANSRSCATSHSSSMASRRPCARP